MNTSRILMNKLLITTFASSLLLFTGSIAGAQTARARIADTPIRVAANLASPIIATLKEGGPVDVVDFEGDWYRVLGANEKGKPRVGYVLAHLIEIVNTEGSSQSAPAPTTSRMARPIAQGSSIPAPLAPFVRFPGDKATDREQALRAEVEALQAELKASQNDDQPTSQVRSGHQIPVNTDVSKRIESRLSGAQ